MACFVDGSRQLGSSRIHFIILRLLRCVLLSKMYGIEILIYVFGCGLWTIKDFLGCGLYTNTKSDTSSIILSERIETF